MRDLTQREDAPIIAIQAPSMINIARLLYLDEIQTVAQIEILANVLGGTVNLTKWGKS